MSGPVTTAAAPRKGALWYGFRTIAWAFLGVRRKSGSEEELARVSPLHIVAVAIGAAVILVFALIAIIKWVVLR
ncbi:MAG: DUF2970 domain-containing protein [Burkholderiaceae bacterium]|nr:MAG: DUF2970 domain-containing protein [Burkholderiaceae bacterium]